MSRKIIYEKRQRKIDISLFGASSSQYLHSILDQEWEIKIEKALLKSKYEFDLENVEFNHRRLESYLLDSLWRDIQQYEKVEEAPIV